MGQGDATLVQGRRAALLVDAGVAIPDGPDLGRRAVVPALRALELGPLPLDEIERLQRIGDHIYGRHKPKFKEQGDAMDVESGISPGECRR